MRKFREHSCRGCRRDRSTEGLPVRAARGRVPRAVASIALVLLLAACGGGGGSTKAPVEGGGPMTTPDTGSTPTPGTGSTTTPDDGSTTTPDDGSTTPDDGSTTPDDGSTANPGGSDSTAIPNRNVSRPTDIPGLVPAAASEAIRKAAVRTPQRGSVKQSSAASGGAPLKVAAARSSVNGETTLTATFSGDGEISIVYDLVLTDICSHCARDDKTDVPDGKWRMAVFYRMIATGASVFLAYTDIEEPTTETVGETRTTRQDADYMAGGVWLSQSTGLSYEIGAFWNGESRFGQTSLGSVTGTATYAGDVFGFHTEQESSDAHPTVVPFYADVSLTADFNADTVNGSIGNFRFLGGRMAGGATLTLQSASIDASKAGGFFAGDTSMTFGGRTFGGKWGGEFFGKGASPSSVGGTFGSATSGNDDSYEAAFFGTFMGYQQ